MSLVPLVRIVDDDKDACKALSFLLKEEGYKTKSFLSGVQFLAEEAETDPGCVILDVKMPEMSGIEVFEKLLERKYPNPVIMLSAHGDITMAVEMVKKGAYNFLEKPVNPEKLLEMVKECCHISLYHKEPLKVMSAAEITEILKMLTPRETEIVKLFAKGLPNRTVAERLGLSPRTIESHRAAVYKKLRINSLEELKQLDQYLP